MPGSIPGVKRPPLMPPPKPAKHLAGAPEEPQKRGWISGPLQALKSLGTGAQRAAGVVGGVITGAPHDGRLTHQQAFDKGPAGLKKLVRKQVEQLQKLELDLIKIARELDPGNKDFQNIVDPSQFNHDNPRRWDADMRLDRAYNAALELMKPGPESPPAKLLEKLPHMQRIAADFDKVDKDSDHNLELLKVVDPQAYKSGQVAAAAYGCLMCLIEKKEGLDAADLARFKGVFRFWPWSSTPSPAVAVSISEEIMKLLELLKKNQSPEVGQNLDECKAAVTAAGASWSDLLHPSSNVTPQNPKAPQKSPEEIRSIFEMIHHAVQPLQFQGNTDTDTETDKNKVKEAGEDDEGAAYTKPAHQPGSLGYFNRESQY